MRVQSAARAGTRLLEDQVERVENAGNPEEDAKDYIDDSVLGRLGFQINRQRREQDRQNNQYQFAHNAVRFLGAEWSARLAKSRNRASPPVSAGSLHINSTWFLRAAPLLSALWVMAR